MREPMPEIELDDLTGEDGIPPVEACLICGKRGIWMRHIVSMMSGKRCVCSLCHAIHIMNRDHSLTVYGFKENE